MVTMSQHNCADMILEMLPEAAETQHHQSFFAKSGSSLLSATSVRQKIYPNYMQKNPIAVLCSQLLDTL